MNISVVTMAGKASVSPITRTTGQSVSGQQNQDQDNDRFAKHFIANLKLFFDEAKQGSTDFLSDFTLKSRVDGTEVKAHKIILASQSKYFRGLFRNNANTCSVSLDYDHSIIEACVEGIYTGKAPLAEEVVQDILMAADYLGIDDLVQQATDFIIKHMDDSNCFDVLIFGCDQGNDKMASCAASYIAKCISDIKDSKELYLLPAKMFSKVLGSNGLVIKENTLGIIITGLSRELQIIALIENYIRLHPENKFEDFLSCIRLDGFDCHNVGIYELVRQTLLIVLNANLEKTERINAVNRAIQISKETSDKSVDDNIVIGAHEIVDCCEKISLDIKKLLIHYLEKPQPFSSISLKERYLNRCVTKLTSAYGSAPEQSHDTQHLNICDIKMGIIRRLVIHTRLWDQRNIIKGMEIHFLGNDQVVKLGLNDGPGNTAHTFELDSDEYITCIEGRSGWYLDQLTFVTNKNRKLGPVGGSGGDKFSTLQLASYSKLLSKKVSCHLRGIQVTQVNTQNQDAIARVKFLMCMIYDKERAYDMEFAELLDAGSFDADYEDDILTSSEDEDESDGGFPGGFPEDD